MRGENRIRPKDQQGKSDYPQGSVPPGSLAGVFNCTKVCVSLPWFYLKRLFVCTQEETGRGAIRLCVELETDNLAK